MTLTSKQYDLLNWIAKIGLPGFAAAYFALSEIWGLPKAAEVVGTATIIDTLLGGLLVKSKSNYVKSGAGIDGSIEIDENGERKMFSLNLDGDPEELAPGQEVTFKVKGAEEEVPLEEAPEEFLEEEPVAPKPRKRAAKPRVKRNPPS